MRRGDYNRHREDVRVVPIRRLENKPDKQTADILTNEPADRSEGSLGSHLGICSNLPGFAADQVRVSGHTPGSQSRQLWRHLSRN
jgi:hypothetical protein